MYFVAFYEQSTRLELAIAMLEKTGIAKSNIVVTPLRDSPMHSGELYMPGQLNLLSPYDKMFLFGAIFSTLGVVYGLILSWGPIIWGLIGAFIGAVIGYLIDLLLLRNRKKEKNQAEMVAVHVKCDETQVKSIESILLGNGAQKVGEIK